MGSVSPNIILPLTAEKQQGWAGAAGTRIPRVPRLHMVGGQTHRGVTKGLAAPGRVWPEIEEILFILITLLQI